MSTHLLSSLSFALFVFALMGCSGEDPERPSTLESIADLPGLATGPCDAGEEQACSITVEQESGIVSCFVGWQSCQQGRWSACQDVVLTAQADPASGQDLDD